MKKKTRKALLTVQRGWRVTPSLLKRIQKIGKKEKRKDNPMVCILLDEACSVRERQ